MSISKSQYIFNLNSILYSILCFIILLCLFRSIDYLVDNGYIYMSNKNIKESYTNTNHTVNLPLNTTSSCSNTCGPTAICSITGQQCTSDIDCSGCQTNVPPTQTQYTPSLPGYDDAGKLSFIPSDSTLTNDFGSSASIYSDDKLSLPGQTNLGNNTWIDTFNESRKLFDERYKPAGLENMPSYPKRPSASGQFTDEGPLAANAYLK